MPNWVGHTEYQRSYTTCTGRYKSLTCDCSGPAVNCMLDLFDSKGNMLARWFESKDKIIELVAFCDRSYVGYIVTRTDRPEPIVSGVQAVACTR